MIRKDSNIMKKNNNRYLEKARNYSLMSEKLKLKGADTKKLEFFIEEYSSLYKTILMIDPDEEEIPQHTSPYMYRRTNSRRMRMLEKGMRIELRRLVNKYKY